MTVSLAAETAARLGRRFGPEASVAHRPNHPGADKLSFVVRTADAMRWVKVAARVEENATLDRWATVGARPASVRPSLPALLATLGGLHTDAALAEILGPSVASRDCALMLDAVIDTAADLVEQPDPAIVSAKDAGWRAAVARYRAHWSA